MVTDLVFVIEQVLASPSLCTGLFVFCITCLAVRVSFTAAAGLSAVARLGSTFSLHSKTTDTTLQLYVTRLLLR